MPTELDTHIDVLSCVEPLRRLQTLGGEMIQQTWLDRPEEEQKEKQTEFVRLQEQLPPAVVTLLRGRISSARRLVAPMRRAKCSSCYMSVPRGDHGPLLAGRRPVLCQHCGVLLFADAEERVAASTKAK